MKLLICILLISTSLLAKNKIVLMKTTFGDLQIELNEKKAPVTVKNFLNYVNAKFYDGIIFHRVIDNFMVQGGGFKKDLSEAKTNPPIINEAGNGLKNLNGTIAMARTSVVNSATAQFFFNVKDNSFLDHQNNSPRGYGYAVFGKVIKGMSVLNRIKKSKVKRSGRFQNLPIENIIILQARVLK